MKRLVLFLLISLVAFGQAQKKRPAITIPAQPAPPPTSEEYKGLQEFPIASLRVEGNSRYSQKAILAVAGIKIGEKANQARFELARDRLIASGAFDSVGYRYFNAEDGKSYDAAFEVVEAVPVYPTRFEELPITPEETKKLLQTNDPLYGPAIPATRPKVEFYQRLLQIYLAREKGFDGIVVGRVESDGTGENLSIVFRPGGAQLPVVATVNFVGNTAVPTANLKPPISMVAIGVPFNEARFRQMLALTVKPIYEARGRLNVKFTDIKTEPSKQVKGMDVTVMVDEGQVYHLGKVSFQGKNPTEHRFDKVAKFRTGDIADMSAVREEVERLTKHFKRLGYIHTVVTPQRQVDDSKQNLDLLIDVDLGEQFKFRSVKFEGLDIESQHVLTKMWGMQPGRPFNPDYPQVFLDRVRDEQIFDNLGTPRSVEKIDENELAVDVSLLFGKAAKANPLLKSEP